MVACYASHCHTLDEITDFAAFSSSLLRLLLLRLVIFDDAFADAAGHWLSPLFMTC